MPRTHFKKQSIASDLKAPIYPSLSHPLHWYSPYSHYRTFCVDINHFLVFLYMFIPYVFVLKNIL